MEKDLVNYNQALELDKLGFNEKCFTFWTTEGELYESEGYYKKGYNVLGEEVLAPTFSQAFRFFREKYKLYPHIFSQINGTFTWCVRWYVNGLQMDIPYESSNSYEEAESACLDKLIEIYNKTFKSE